MATFLTFPKAAAFFGPFIGRLLFLIGFGWLVAQVLYPQAAVAQEEESQAKASTFDRLLGALAKHYELGLGDDLLMAEFPDRSTADSLVSELIGIGIRNRGSSSGGRGWTKHLAADELLLNFGEGLRNNRGFHGPTNLEYVDAEQLKLPLRSMAIESVKGENSFAGFHYGGLKGDLCRVRQNKQGGLVFQQIPALAATDQPSPISVGSASIVQLWKTAGPQIESEISAGLKSFGLSPPPTRMHPELLSMVRAQLDTSGELWEEFSRMAKELQSESFEQRQAAATQLKDEFDQWSALIRNGVNNSSFSVSVRAELKKILADKGSPKDRQMVQIVEALDLKNDPEFLLAILKSSAPGDSRQPIVDRLESVTQKDFGDAPDRWQAFLDARPPRAIQSSEFTWNLGDALEQNPMALASDDVGRLIQITCDEGGRLRIDREAWSEMFDGKSPQELAAEVKRELENRKLPPSWLFDLANDPYIKDVYSHEHLLFESLCDRIGQLNSLESLRSRAASRNRRTANMAREGGGISLSLRMNSEGNVLRRPAAAAQFFCFQFSQRDVKELDVGQTRMWVIDDYQGNVRVTLCLENPWLICDLLQSDSGAARLVFIQNETVHVATGDSFLELWQQQARLVDDRILPLFKRYGIQVSDEMGGPIEFAPKK